jgi:hypothetical protein
MVFDLGLQVQNLLVPAPSAGYAIHHGHQKGSCDDLAGVFQAAAGIPPKGHRQPTGKLCMATQTIPNIPEVGHAVRVRNRLATVRAVEPYESRDAQGRLHIVERYFKTASSNSA